MYQISIQLPRVRAKDLFDQLDVIDPAWTYAKCSGPNDLGHKNIHEHNIRMIKKWHDQQKEGNCMVVLWVSKEAAMLLKLSWPDCYNIKELTG